jgi:hypothetical protein
MLSTLQHCQEFKKKGEKQAIKFFPCYDGPYNTIDVHAATSNYTLELPNTPNTYLTYHASELKPFPPNNPTLFPSCKLSQPPSIVTSNGMEEYLVQEIMTLAPMAEDTNILCDRLDMVPNTTAGWPVPLSKIVKHSMFGLKQRVWTQPLSSFFHWVF